MWLGGTSREKTPRNTQIHVIFTPFFLPHWVGAWRAERRGMMPRQVCSYLGSLGPWAQLVFKDWMVHEILLFKHQILATAANNIDNNTHPDEYDIEVLKQNFYLFGWFAQCSLVMLRHLYCIDILLSVHVIESFISFSNKNMRIHSLLLCPNWIIYNDQ